MAGRGTSMQSVWSASTGPVTVINMESWVSKLDRSRPCWNDYRQLLAQLSSEEFPGPVALSRLLPDETRSQGGRSIQFVDSGEIPGVPYETHIHASGQVSTRNGSWHDLFNALVWCRFPRLKAAMNAVHFREYQHNRGTGRGTVRDALTLLDESGAIVVSSDRLLLDAVAQRLWGCVFDDGFAVEAQNFDPGKLNIAVCGHALLEKFLDPYKAITARAVLIHLGEVSRFSSRESLISLLDRELADRLLDARLIGSPADLAPLPVMGIPGWWPSDVQDKAFYRDPDVFRPLRRGVLPATVFELFPE